MTLWNKIVLGSKFLFGGFESATDYLCKILNNFIGNGVTKERIQKACAYVRTVLGFLRKYKDYCPGKWLPYYEKLLDTVQTLLDVFEDCQVSTDDINKTIQSVQAAIDEWMKD